MVVIGSVNIVDLGTKLQELRKRRGLTQEKLAEILFVSRTAVSKWESGRGYPNVDSLKAISVFFEVTIDELLSGDELIIIAEEDRKQTKLRFRDVVFGLLDCAVVVFYFLPLFGQKVDGVIQAVSLSFLTEVSTWLRIIYFSIVTAIVLFGVIILALQNCNKVFWIQNKSKFSLILNIAGTVLFIVGMQPYAAVLLFAFLLIKVLILIKGK